MDEGTGQSAEDLSFYANNATLGTTIDADASDPDWVPANILILGTEDRSIKNPIPSEYYLSQNYPNPFNPDTRIDYSLPEKSFVTLKIYDILGEKVFTLINEEKSRGNYEIEFDASSLASGIYIYKLQAGSFTETRKMVLIR
jgi:hypothetical protein